MKKKKEELRKLQVLSKLYDLKPFYYQRNYDIDDAALQLAMELVVAVLEQKKKFEDEIEMKTDETEQKLQNFKNEMEKIVELSLECIFDVKNMIKLGNFLNGKKEYLLVIFVGKRCQDRLEEQKAEFEEREKLKKECERLDSLRLQYLVKQEESDGLNKEEVTKKLEEARVALSKLPNIVDIQAEIDERNRLLLEVIELIFSAAKC